MHQDQTLGLKQGDWIVHRVTGKKLYRFRCGPITKYEWAGHHYSYRRRAYGGLRHPHTLSSIRMAQAHRSEGLKVRAGGNLHLPTAWDDTFAHAENWKRHRRFQYRA